jgi:hypothetical protein
MQIMVKKSQDLLRCSAVEKVTVADPHKKAKRSITSHTVEVTEHPKVTALCSNVHIKGPKKRKGKKWKRGSF